MERRHADRPVTNADQSFRERAIAATETVEEPVVSKQARVVEEVAVSKDVQQRTETVRDTVRRTDVEVEQVGSQQQGRGGGSSSTRPSACSSPRSPAAC